MANPKKSKAFIITFILILLLLLVGYWLYSKKDTILKTDGLNIGRIFEPLIGSLDMKDVGVIGDPNSGTTNKAYTNQIKVIAKENILAGSLVYLSGVSPDGTPIISAYDPNNSMMDDIIPFGISNTNINGGSSGEIYTSITISVQAVENININNQVYLVGINPNGVPIVAVYDPNNSSMNGIVPFGVSNESIGSGGTGVVTINTGGSTNQGLWGSIRNTFDKIANTVGGVFDSVFNRNDNNQNNNYEYEYDPNNNIYNFPVVNITASPSSVPVGGSSIISWTSTNSLSCDAGNGTKTGTSGSFDTGPLNDSRSFSISCTGENGTISNSIIVRIANREIDPFKFPIVTARANPSPINPGESSTISWESSNTDSCDSGVGNPTTTSGNFSTGPLNNTKSYTIICTGKDGSTGRNVFVIVKNDGEFDNTICKNGADNPPTCTTINGSCINGNTNPPLCLNPNNLICEKDGVVIDCADMYGVVCKKDGVVVDCADMDGFVCKKDGVVVNCWSENISDLFICNDNVDNDVDGKIDELDPECHSDGDIYNTYSYVSTWTSESVRPSSACNNKNDDDKDGKIDIEDPECHTDGNANNPSSYSPNHFSESIKIVTSQCGDGIDNDKKEGTDSEDPSCHTDFNKDNALSYDKNIKNEGRVKISAQCGDGLNNDNQEGSDYKDKDCHTDLNINNWESYYPDIYSEKYGDGIPIPGEECSNGAINYPRCDEFGSNFCAQNKITKELEKDKKANDKEQVRSLQLILSKLTSPSLGTTYLKSNAVDGDFGEGTRLAVETFQKDNGLNFATKQGSVDKETMDLLNAKCEQFLNGGGEKCTNGAVNPTLCTIDANGKCLNKAVNPPICTINSDGKCLNGAINPPTCNVQPTIEVNKCAIFDQYPLEFNDDEKAQLADLLRKFYLLAPTLKTEDDLNLVYNEIDRYKELINQVKDLTTQCYQQTGPSYTGPTKRLGNPWFMSSTTVTGSGGTPPESYVDETKYSTKKINDNPNYIMKSHGNDRPRSLKDTWETFVNNASPSMLGVIGGGITIKKLVDAAGTVPPFYLTESNTKYTPLITQLPSAQQRRGYNQNWEFYIDFDVNKVMLERLREFELLLYIW